MTTESNEFIRRKIRVLIADDSAFVRRLLESILAREPRIEIVGSAQSGRQAVAEFARLKPDLLLLDVEMPEMDGLQALSQIRRLDRKTSIIMCSTLTRRGVQVTIEALARGATDYVSKRGAGSTLEPGTPSLEQQLIPKILGLFPEKLVIDTPELREPGPRPSAFSIPGLELVVIGVSTGGPAALEVLLPQFAPEFPLPILIVQHMPQQFTGQLAHRLNHLCPLHVAEAVDGVRPKPGVVSIARGDWHLEVTRDFRLRLHQQDLQNFCRPSVDLLFKSAAIACSGKLLGVILTGMGSDGLEGCRAIRRSGGAVFAQDNASSVVWGMPGSVVQAGLTHKVCALNAMAAEVNRFVSASQKRLTGVVA